jgi:hypothetical protein
MEIVDERNIETRPYRFGDFDILAVNMHPYIERLEKFQVYGCHRTGWHFLQKSVRLRKVLFLEMEPEEGWEWL